MSQRSESLLEKYTETKAGAGTGTSASGAQHVGERTGLNPKSQHIHPPDCC